MESIIRADMFFFLTGVAVIVFTSALVVLVVYLTLIARDIRYIMKLARGQADAIQGDIERLRMAFNEKKWNIKDWFSKVRQSSRKKGRESIS